MLSEREIVRFFGPDVELLALVVVLRVEPSNRIDFCRSGFSGDESIDMQLKAWCDAASKASESLELCRFGLVGDKLMDKLVTEEEALLPCCANSLFTDVWREGFMGDASIGKHWI